jgi:hypothetical protein
MGAAMKLGSFAAVLALGVLAAVGCDGGGSGGASGGDLGAPPDLTGGGDDGPPPGTVSDDRYVLDEDPALRNPERGITYWWDNDDPGNDAHTLRNHFLWLGDSCAQPLAWHGRGDAATSAVLRDWADTAVALAARGYKVVFRPRYDTPAAQGAPNGCGRLEADSWARMQSHADAIAALLGDDEIRPIVAFVEMGYLGSWGEWNGAATGCAPDIAACRAYAPVLFAASVGQDRISLLRDVVQKYAAAGLRRPIELRRPEFHRDAVVAYQVAATRMGFYDDCFAVDDTDVGTFTTMEGDFTAGTYPDLYPAASLGSVAEAKAYFAANAAAGTQGGETCNRDPAHSEGWYTDPASVLRRLDGDRFSYLHAAYADGFRARMMEGGQWDVLRSRLGYRFQVLSARYTAEAAPGAPVTVAVTVANSGYAGLALDRLAYLALHGPGGDYVVGAHDPGLGGATLIVPTVSTGDHVQGWSKDATTTFLQTFAAPPVAGSYAIHLAIPDVDCIGNARCSDQLRRDYAIKLATRRDGHPLFDDTRGSNDLGVKLLVRTE